MKSKLTKLVHLFATQLQRSPKQHVLVEQAAADFLLQSKQLLLKTHGLQHLSEVAGHQLVPMINLHSK
jgi:hypothetical protein